MCLLRAIYRYENPLNSMDAVSCQVKETLPPCQLDAGLRLAVERIKYYEVDAKTAANVTKKPKEPKSGKGNVAQE